MSKELHDMIPKYVRQRESTRIFYATEEILARGDFLPCDAKGNFLSTGEMKLPEIKAGIEGPAQDKKKIRLNALREKARILKVRGWNNAKEPTLVKAIAEAEKELAQEAALKAAEEAKALQADKETDVKEETAEDAPEAEESTKD